MSSFADAECRDEHEHAAKVLSLADGSDCHLGDLHVLEVAFRRQCTLESHSHENARLVFVISGEVGETYESDSILCDANSFSFHPEVLPHRNDIGAEDARAIVIEFCSERSRSLLSLVDADVAPFTTPARRLREAAIEMSRALHRQDEASPLLVEAIALEMVARAARLIRERSDPIPAPAFLDVARSLIESRIDRAPTLAMVASVVGVTPRQLTDAFRVHAHTTFRSYVRERRIARVLKLLADPSMPIADVALSAGFCDQSHLTRELRRVTGLTPKAWREQSGTRSGESF
ncbi:MAG: helix-turn-helix transcriptional regulator [Thermoanaerobaculia bacterium]